MSQYLNTPMEAATTWRGQDQADKTDWIQHLEPSQVEELVESAQRIAQRGVNPLELEKKDFALPSLSGLCDSLLQHLEGGRGFSLIRSLPISEYSEEEITAMFWGLGTQIGIPEPQDAARNRLHHVRDTGEKIENNSNLRSYQTNRAIKFHNDGSDIFMLLCLRNAINGGRSKLVSAVSVFNEILRRNPDLASLLQQPFYFDARGQQLPGTPRCQNVPIFNYYKGYLSVLYKRGYIHLAQRFEDVPKLSQEQLAALDLMDEVCDEFALEFEMRPGDILVANNYDLLHGRSSFQNDGPPDRARHMLRLWLTIPNGRPLPPAFENTREFHYSYARRSVS